MATQIVNMTPHTVTLRTESGDRSFPASGQTARVSVNMTPAASLDGLCCSRRQLGDVVGITTSPLEGEYYIVSTLVFDASAAEVARAEASMVSDGEFCSGARERYLALVARHASLLVPDSGPDAIRDERGQIQAVRRFIVA